MERDLLLDRGRGLVMVYIVCIVHSLYWLGIGGEPLKSFALIEMPIIFFIAGASQRYSRKSDGIVAAVKNRFLRVAFPYYVYAAVSVAIVIAIGLLKGEAVAFTTKSIVKIVVMYNIDGVPFPFHLWFIIPYLVIAVSFVVQKNVIAAIGGG